MRRRVWGGGWCLAGLLLGLGACSQERQAPPAGTARAGEAGTEPAAASGHGGASGGGWPWSHCCPPSERPACCMAYGGFTNQPGLCLYACDGMPAPDEAWQRGTDSFGCPIWVEPKKWTRCCGCLDAEAKN